MKKIYSVLLIVIMALLLVSCGGKAPVKSYTEAEEIQTVNCHIAYGFSPDGKLFLSYSDNTIEVLDLETEEVEYDIDPQIKLLSRRKALWSKSGDSFILGDSVYAPIELMLMKSENYICYSLDDDEGDKITFEDVETSYLKGGVLIYSPSWSADGKGIVYSAIDDKELRIVKADVQSGDAEVLYEARDRCDYTQAVELTDGLLLCEVNGYKAGDNEIFLYDVKKDEETELEDVVDANREDRWAYYEIKDLSEDRKTVLINKYIRLANEAELTLAKCIILKFDQRFKSYTVKTISFGIAADSSEEAYAYNPELIMNKAPNRIGYSAALSPDGGFIISREDEIVSFSEGKANEAKQQLVLHDLNSDKQHVLYEADEGEAFGIASGINGNSEPIFISQNGLMAVWFMDGYRIFALE